MAWKTKGRHLSSSGRLLGVNDDDGDDNVNYYSEYKNTNDIQILSINIKHQS